MRTTPLPLVALLAAACSGVGDKDTTDTGDGTPPMTTSPPMPPPMTTPPMDYTTPMPPPMTTPPMPYTTGDTGGTGSGSGAGSASRTPQAPPGLSPLPPGSPVAR